MTTKLKIVIADDEADIRHGLRRLLTRLGYNVVGEAADGLALVAVCDAERPDLVITDFRMPEKSGVEAANEIVEKQDIPFIIVSSYDPAVDQKPAFISDYLQKPVCVSELKAAIERACPA
ncbi:response regulator [Mariniblastus fucicola]|nr:response regulator [Mariniblastus fucicola]